MKNTPYIDAHCHLADPRFDARLAEVLQRSEAAGISTWIQGGINPADWQRQRELCARYPGRIWTTFGLHPWWVARATEAECAGALDLLKQQLPEADGLGETGLDFSPKHDSPVGNTRQLQYFEMQLELAKTLSKPLVLHIVHAHEAALDVLEDSGPFAASGLVHAFSAPPEIAERYVGLGFLLSVGAAATKAGHKGLKFALPHIPPGQLVVETDCPDLPPEGVAPGQNEPAQLLPIAKAIGLIRQEGAEALLTRSAENLRRLFKKSAES